MPQPLKILIAEDQPADGELVLRELRRAGFDPDWHRVDTEAEYLERLHGGLDLVLSDYEMPQFSGLRAIELLKEQGLDVPIIIVSGTIGEDTAVAAMKLGAADYLLKDRLGRLGAAVTHAMAETRLRRERREGEAALRLAQGQLAQLLEHSPAVLYVLKLDGDKIIPRLVSENITTLLGFTAAEASSYDWWFERLHPDDRERVLKSVAATIDTGSDRVEYRLRHKDGHYCWVDDARRLIRNPDAVSGELIGAWTDVTERRRAEDIVRQASGRAVRNRRKNVRIELAIFVAATASFYALAARFNWFDAIMRWFLVHEFDRLDEVNFTIIFVMAGSGVFAFRRWRETESELSGRMQVQGALSLLHDELDRQVKQRTKELSRANDALHLDIAERKRAEVALMDSEARFRELAETVNEVFWITSPEKDKMIYISPAYERIWGRPCQSLYESPRTWLDAIHPDDRKRVLDAAGSKQSDGSYDEEYRILRPDGSERWIHDRAFPVRGSDGALLRLVGAAEDITESKKLHEQFLRAQRMEAIGTLAGGIAHDLNNILAPVLMAPTLLKASAKTDHERKLLELIEQGARRGSNVVRQLLTFSRGTGGERLSVQLRHLLKEMGEIMKETFPRDIEISDKAARDLRPVVGDPTQLHQVILNLCVNARDAMPDGGKLSLEATNVELSAADVKPHPPAAPGPHVAVSVTDTGHGIPPAIVDRIFDPFFTTKPPTKGTGLGLSTVLGIVRSHNGFITVASAPGRGTTFTVHLPVASEVIQTGSGRPADALPSGHGELILVVDDEAPIRSATRLMLEQQGYRVLTAGDGAEALAIFLQDRDAVRLVFTDVMMPVMGGINLARALRAVHPKLKILATSGLADQANYADLKAVGVDRIVAKPCEPRDVLEAIGELLTPSDWSV